MTLVEAMMILKMDVYAASTVAMTYIGGTPSFGSPIVTGFAQASKGIRFEQVCEAISTEGAGGEGRTIAIGTDTLQDGGPAFNIYGPNSESTGNLYENFELYPQQIDFASLGLIPELNIGTKTISGIHSTGVTAGTGVILESLSFVDPNVARGGGSIYGYETGFSILREIVRINQLIENFVAQNYSVTTDGSTIDGIGSPADPIGVTDGGITNTSSHWSYITFQDREWYYRDSVDASCPK